MAKELVRECTIRKETRNGVLGYVVTGPNGNSIFFQCLLVIRTDLMGTNTVFTGWGILMIGELIYWMFLKVFILMPILIIGLEHFDL